ncbi:DUF4376 domain-containing protein [Paracoccus sp. SY]|uniref:DUF4376 domain-containing protein n=1 Tax=Paracoccus sp. SY TaxID=1330255 RepID=UPI000CD2A004|nr:DUF4376 domain-containing protein [Paracoccus sp. SY]
MIDWTKAVTLEARAATRDAMAREAIRARRDAAISTGIYVAGIPVGTDDQSQARITGAALAAMRDAAYSVAWKGSDGVFVTLTADQVLTVADAIRAHVQACFDREAALLSDLTTGQSYAVNEGWPSQDVRLADGAALAHRVGAGVYRVLTSNADWDAEAPEGLTVTLSHDGTALTVWVWRGTSLADIPTGQHLTLRPISED